MSEPELQRLLGWIHDRTNRGLSGMKRSERDAALADVCHATQPYLKYWDGKHTPGDPLHMWFGERP